MKGANKWLAQLALALFFVASAGEADARRVRVKPTPIPKPDGIPRTPPGKPSLPSLGGPQQPSQSCEGYGDCSDNITDFRELCSSPDSKLTLSFCDDARTEFSPNGKKTITEILRQRGIVK